MPNFSRNMMHLCMIIVIIVAIIFTALILVLKYNEDGETNMPFSISKISIISTVDAKDVENGNDKWNLQVSQNNDIYLYIEKNDNYKKTETIQTVTIDNINIIKQPAKGAITIYKPSKNKTAIFENKEEYKATEIIFNGDKSTNMQNLQISNQAGILSFRCANDNIDTYISNKDKSMNYGELLQKLKINNEELQATIAFDITIKLDSGISFKSPCSIDIPVGDIVKEGKTSIEIKDLNDIVFKRIDN